MAVASMSSMVPVAIKVDPPPAVPNADTADPEQQPVVTKRRRRRTRGRKQSRTPQVKQDHDVDDDATTVASSGSDGSNRTTDAAYKNASSTKHNKRSKQQQQQQQQKQQVPQPLTKTQQQQYLAMDCEMVGAGLFGQRSMLARVTIVDWHHHVVYDAYVTPTEDVTDYRSFVSGITEQDLLRNGVDYEIVRRRVADLLAGKILVGHALKNDLAALQLSHPWHSIRDTARYEPFMKKLDDHDDRNNNNILWPRKLKEITLEKLRREIQPYGVAHCPIEDAVAALQLYKLVRVRWESIMEYKIHKTAEIMLLQTRECQAQYQQQQEQTCILVTQ